MSVKRILNMIEKIIVKQYNSFINQEINDIQIQY